LIAKQKVELSLSTAYKPTGVLLIYSFAEILSM